MDKTKIGVAAALAALGLGALGGTAMKASASDASVKPTTAPAAAVEQVEPDAGLPDTDAVQEEVGDQTGADDAAEAAETESASAEEPGDENLPGGGHQDPDGQEVDHQFEGVE